MADLRYLVLSDLHLGAAYSLLTHIAEDGAITPGQPGRALSALGDVLRRTLAPLAGATPPTLVLMGDVVLGGSSVPESQALKRDIARYIEST